MSLVKARFVTACQQLLALAVVLVVLTPAASVVSLDVVHQHPGTSGQLRAGGTLAAYSRVAEEPTVLPAGSVEAEVTEYALTPPTTMVGRRRATAATAHARVAPGGRRGTTEITSRPQPVTGYGAVGLTWAPEAQVDDEQAAFEVRTRQDGTWSPWRELEYHDEHAPDPGTMEARRARPGTDPLFVGHVEEVQVRATTAQPPADLRMAVVAPGTAPDTTVARPAIDTAELDDDAEGGDEAGGTDPAGADPATDPADGGAGDDALDLQAATYTEKPQIFSRAQWGADESLRDKSSLAYYEVHAGFVHHTVNANDYRRREVPGIIRSIYAYHTQSRGWSDVGYNFLVDRFGRIWEGRAGGVDRPVVGAHTLGYNEYSFAMSAIGNFETARPSAAVLQAYGALFAWKLSLHGVDPSSTSQRVGSRSFPAVNGHRDAGSTACPGRHLYAQLGTIRQIAADTLRGWDGRELESDVAGAEYPDLLVRRASDDQGFVIPTAGLTAFRRARAVPGSWADASAVVASPDLTGDGRTDLVVRDADGVTTIRPGDGQGGFGEPSRRLGAFAGLDLLAAAGDLDDDGRQDLVARDPASGRLDAFLGNGAGSFERRSLGTGWDGHDLLVGPGDVTGDGRDDLLGRDGQGTLWLHSGEPGLALADPVALQGRWGRYDVITAGGDLTLDGRNDLFVRRAGNGRGMVLPGLGDGSFGRGQGRVGRVRGKDLVLVGQVRGDAAPDLVVRRKGRLMVQENRGTTELGEPIPMGLELGAANLLLNVGDWDRDGDGDLVVRERRGRLLLHLGDGTGAFSGEVVLGRGFGRVDLLAAVGDMTGDGWPDLMGQPRGGAMRIYPGQGLDGLAPSYVAHSAISAQRQVGIGRWDGDGSPDTLLRSGDRLVVYRGNGPGGLTNGTQLPVGLGRYDWVIGVSDIRGQGHADVLARQRNNGTLWLLEATQDGLEKRRYLGEGLGQYDLAG